MDRAISIDISDVLEFAQRLGVAPDIVQTEIAETAYAAGVIVHGRALDYVPVDTGTLESSIGPTVVSGNADSVMAIVPVGAEYGIYVEEGTRYMAGRRYMARALADEENNILDLFGEMADRILKRLGGQP